MNVFISGGSSTTALALADFFLSKGDFVYTTYHNNKAALKNLAKKYQNIKFIKCDFNSSNAAKNINSLEIETLDVILNVFGPYMEVDMETSKEGVSDFEYMLKTNVIYVDTVIKMLYPKMEQNGGSIINFAYSNANKDHFSLPRTYYHIAKASLLDLTRAYAKLLGKYNINVNSISPGIQSYSVDISGFSPCKIPQKRFGTTDDIINAVEFLISKKSRYISGTNIIVSGGYNVV